jgi:predicted dehydrogenase
MKKIRVLLAGIGGYGLYYANALLDDSDADRELAGVADPFAEKSPRYEDIKSRNIPVFKTPEEFYQNHDADLAVVSSPIHTHYRYSTLALEKGSYVLCEKPFCADLGQLDTLIKKEKKSGRFVAVGFQHCFSDASIALKEDILAGVLGKPIRFKTICMPRRGDIYYQRNSWVGRLKFEGETILDSPLNNACAHELELMLFLLGKSPETSADVLSVDAELWRARRGIENYDAAALRLKTGAGAELYYFTAHCIEEAQIGPWWEGLFEKGTVRCGESSRDITVAFNDGSTKSYGSLDGGKMMLKLDKVVDAVRNGRRPSCTLETVRSHLKTVTMVQEFPVKAVPEEKIAKGKNEAGDSFYYIPGFSQALIRCYRENHLPRETGYTL